MERPWSKGRRALAAAAVVLTALLGGSATAQIAEVGNGGPGPVKAEHLTAELTALSPQIAVGGTLQVGLVLTIQEGWHVYWINAGDSGEPPAIHWTLPKGVTAGPMQFPPPSRLPLGPLMDFGYQDSVAFPVRLTASPTLHPGKLHLDAHVSWLVCSSVCLPGKAHLGMDLEAVKGPLPKPAEVGALGTALAELPSPLSDGMSAEAVTDAKQILVTFKTGSRETSAQIYPYDSEVIENAAAQRVESLSDGAKVWLKRAQDSVSPPATLHALVEFPDIGAFDFSVPVSQGVVPAPPLAAQAMPDSNPDQDQSQTQPLTALSAIGLAFLGGMLLNLMPCVFPVLFLKGLSLLHSAGEERARQRSHGWMYTAGIVVSFWAIVAGLLILRAGGRALGWGFQLQSPGFVAVLASLVFFLGLSLAGQFEIGLSLTSVGGGLARKPGLTGSFFTGVLATVVATPCMAPLMGAAVGFALVQQAWLTFLVFTSLALGLAAPFLALTMQPRWTRALPPPGTWMETLKNLVSVPLFATAIWLTWVYGQLYSPDGVNHMAWLLSCFLVLAVAGWALGRWPAKRGATLAAVVLIAGALALPLHRPAVDKLVWKPYTQANFAAARASGNPVFIDFTAAWCLSCQVNERAVLESGAVERALGKNRMQLLKADWTQYDPMITKQLASLGRSGVPTYVIYPPGAISNPDVLPEVLTEQVVLKAIRTDARPMGSQTAKSR